MGNPFPSDKKKYPFDAVTREQWLDAAIPEWQGATESEKSIQLEKGIVIKPYYDVSDLPKEINSTLSVSKNSVYGSRAWLNMPLVDVSNDAHANREALMLLNSGADGILFQIHKNSDPQELLKNIELNYCNVAFKIESDSGSFLNDFRTLLTGRRYDPSSVYGAVFYENSKKKTPVDFSRWKGFYSCGLVATPVRDSVIDSLANVLSDAAREIELGDQAGELEKSLNAVAFVVEAGNDFFIEIAKLRVLRMLWYQIARSWKSDYAFPVFIHSISQPWIQPEWQPHGNLLKSTTSAMSSVLGGCDALTVRPEDAGSWTMQRIALNVSTVLREESHFSKVADPVAGAYYLENLIDQIARAVWTKFQQLQ